MKHLIKIAEKMWKLDFTELPSHPGKLMKTAIMLSGRVEKLENWITENTDYDGTTIGYKEERKKEETVEYELHADGVKIK